MMSNASDAALQAVHHASRLVAEALKQAPQFGVYLHARDQLETMRQVLTEPGRWKESRAFVDIELMAVRELVDDEPELAVALMKAAHRFQQFCCPWRAARFIDPRCCSACVPKVPDLQPMTQAIDKDERLRQALVVISVRAWRVLRIWT